MATHYVKSEPSADLALKHDIIAQLNYLYAMSSYFGWHESCLYLGAARECILEMIGHQNNENS